MQADSSFKVYADQVALICCVLAIPSVGSCRSQSSAEVGKIIEVDLFQSIAMVFLYALHCRKISISYLSNPKRFYQGMWAMANEQIKAASVFYSYAHRDKALRDRLDKHLVNLRRQGHITSWHDCDINAGQDWMSEINEHLRRANIILLLISPDFMNSEYCYSVEMTHALKRHYEGQAYVIPIILRYVDWENAPFSKLQVLPEAGRPIVSTHWRNYDEAFLEVVKGIRKVIQDLAVTSSQVQISLRNDLHTPNAKRTLADVPSWTIPFRRNPFFTGREELLRQLHNKLNKRENAESFVYPQMICGLGGIGKTQFVVEYVYRYRREYSFIFWIRSGSYDTLIADFVTVASLLGLPEGSEQKQYLMVMSVKRWLDSHERWLLIFDDVEDLEIISKFLPTADTGHILLTTRAQITGTFADMVGMDKMDIEEAILLLLRRAKILAMDALMQQVSQVERTIAKAIAVELDGLPLALDQAGAYIEETGCGLAGYLGLYQELLHRKALLERRSHWSSDHPESVATTWSLSFQRIEQANLAATNLLYLCTFLDPGAIPEEIITAGAPYLGPVLRPVASDPLKLNECIEELRRFSLLKRDPEAKQFNIHRLVQAVLLDRMDKSTQYRWAKRVVQAVNEVLPGTDLTKLSKMRRYLPQMQVCVALIERYSLTFPAAVRLLSETADYLREYSLYGKAEILYKQALRIYEEKYRSNHSKLASILNSLAILYFEQERYNQAEPLLQRALEICERVMGPEHPDTVNNLSCLANLYITQYKYDQAEPLLQRALEICERVMGPEHPDTAENLNHLAWLYYGKGHYERTEPLLQRALAIQEKVLGLEHPSAANTLSNLARFYVFQAKYDLAEPILQRVLQIREKILGSEHPNTANTLNNLAHIYINQGKHDLAESLLQRALVIHEEILGPDHLNTVNILNNLANLYIDKNKYKDAELLLSRILNVREKILGSEHLSTATSLSNLAQLYFLQEKHIEAELFLQRAVAIQEKVLGSENPRFVKILENYASFLRTIKREEAATLFEDRAKTIHSRSTT